SCTTRPIMMSSARARSFASTSSPATTPILAQPCSRKCAIAPGMSTPSPDIVRVAPEPCARQPVEPCARVGRERALDGGDRLVEVLDGRWPREDRVHVRPRRQPRVRELDERAPLALRDGGHLVDAGEHLARPESALVHRVRVEARSLLRRLFE